MGNIQTCSVAPPEMSLVGRLEIRPAAIGIDHWKDIDTLNVTFLDDDTPGYGPFRSG